MNETPSEIEVTLLKQRLEQRDGYVPADYGARLQHALFLRRQTIDPPGEQRLHRRRHVDRGDLCHEAVRSALAAERACLHEGSDALLEEERVALGAIDQHSLERHELRAITHQRLEQLRSEERRVGKAGRSRASE